MTVSNELLTIVCAFATLVAALAWLYAYKCWDFCRDTEVYIKNVAERPPGIKRLTDIECELTELTDSLTAIHASMKKLRARVGMRENRQQKATQADEVPDSKVDPAGFKRAMRLKLGAGKL